MPPPSGDPVTTEERHHRAFRPAVPAASDLRPHLRPFRFGENIRHRARSPKSAASFNRRSVSSDILPLPCIRELTGPLCIDRVFRRSLMPRSNDWTRDQLLMALRLYIRLPFGRLHGTNPEIVRAAGAIGRTPGGLAMKACNFASLDPAQRARGISALGNTSKSDRELWAEYQQNPEGVSAAAEEASATFRRAAIACARAGIHGLDRPHGSRATRPRPSSTRLLPSRRPRQLRKPLRTHWAGTSRIAERKPHYALEPIGRPPRPSHQRHLPQRLT